MFSLEDDARSYLSVQLGGIDMTQAPYESIKSCIDQSYEGGWTAYETDFRRVMATQSKPQAAPTPFQMWAKLSHIIGGSRQLWQLRPHQEVLSVDITDTEVKAVLKVARTDERTTRDVVTYGRKLIVWKRTDSGWSAPESIEFYGEEAEEFVRWGRVRTPDYVASQRDQYETCYRPGTHKSPLQGPAARLGVTREELHDLPKGK